MEEKLERLEQYCRGVSSRFSLGYLYPDDVDLVKGSVGAAFIRTYCYLKIGESSKINSFRTVLESDKGGKKFPHLRAIAKSKRLYVTTLSAEEGPWTVGQKNKKSVSAH